MRLDKLLAHTGFGTRKEVKKIIKDGYIEVNGKIIKNAGTKVDPDKDDVRIGGERMYYEEFIYFMLKNNKGGNFICHVLQDLYGRNHVVMVFH